LSLNHIKNLPIRLDAFIKFEYKEAPEYYQLVLNILCVTQFMAPSITVLQALLSEKLIEV